MKEDLVNLPFFLENGFVKKKCLSCGKIFWTLNKDAKYCGDQPCIDYEFINNPVKSNFTAVHNVRKAFIGFFEKNDHKPIERYPVVARWRNDVFLVGASIYDFQPWVTEGLVNPPGNPLVISQPSIRLTDVDNVGRTGRHLTGFEMMAHHAFNIRGAKIYWANQTVKYAFDLLTNVYKIPPEEISFKFDWWSGGGNAGEDYEVLVRGLEVATLVFMHYKVTDGDVKEMGNKIVDTGYGLERIFWLLQGTPTIYEAVFGELVEKFREKIGLEPLPDDIICSLARKMGKLDYKETELTLGVKRDIASNFNLTLEELDNMLRPHESLYAVLDHSRTVLWMIGDGIVPSNVGAGYLARLLIRRGIRYLNNLETDIRFKDIVEEQIYYWRNDFPEYLEIKDEILDIIEHEESRYNETVRRGKKIVKSLLPKLVAKKVSVFPIDELVVLYDSHGITPDIVEKIAKDYGIKVEVGHDFYSMLASRHETAKRTQVIDDFILKIKEKVEGLPPTIPLYYIDTYLRTSTGKVIKVIDEGYVVLDKTVFYPEGGGQPSDIGKIYSSAGVCDVEWVGKIGKVIIHKCRGDIPPEGEEVTGVIDYERRKALMRNHTATHVILGALRRVLGKHVWQTGAQKGVEQSRLDITHHKRITREEIEKIEQLANQVVMENRKVNKFEMNRTEAERRYGFVLYQGGVVPESTLRIVEIEGWDVEACGGIHCDYTGEIGIIKIVKVERIQDGVSRIIFKVGDAAVRHVQTHEKVLNNIGEMLKTDITEIDKKVQQILEENKMLRKKVEKAEDVFLKMEALDLLKKKGETVDSFTVLVAKLEGKPEKVKEIALTAGKSNPSSIVLLLSQEEYFALKIGSEILGKGITAIEIFKDVLVPLGWKGGGSKDLVQGRGGTHDIKMLQERIIRYLKERCR